MNHLTLTQLIHQLGGTEKVTGFFLVLARVTPLFIVAPLFSSRMVPLFIVAPLFSSRMVPLRVRGVVAVGLAMGMTSVALHGQHIPGAPMQVAGLLVDQLLVGLAFAYAVSVVFAAIQAAGAITDAVSGFSFGSIVDPINGNQGGALAQVYGLVGVALFIAIGGDAWLLRGLGRTFDLVPLSRGPKLGPLVGAAEHTFATIFGAALEVAAPALLALLITDVAFGMVSRVVPQLNVFAVGFPLKIGVALLITGTSLPFLSGWMSDQLTNSVGVALHALQVG